MNLPFYWVDAFTDRPFAGNPAGVCPLEQWLEDELMQRMARQHGLSETAFLVPKGPGRWHIRWFTPASEVDLCGHATLASAHVLLNETKAAAGRIEFESRSGPLFAVREGGRISMDFPRADPQEAALGREVVEVLGRRPEWLGLTPSSWFAVLPQEEEVRALKPNLAALGRLSPGRLIVTAAAKDPGIDFVSRFFAPEVGVAEDPVTGSAHCALAPFWAGRLGKSALRARQVSARGGELWCRLEGRRVHIAGLACTYLRGSIEL